MRHISAILGVLLAVLPAGAQGFGQGFGGAPVFSPITATDDDITFNAYPNGDRIPDYSFCGYMAGEAALPDLLKDSSVPVIRLEAPAGDATSLLQGIIDHASTLPVQSNGFRAVVLLDKGTFNIGGALKISTGGIVIRGSGPGTVIKGTGFSRETLIRIEGKDDRTYSEQKAIACEYLPVNSTVIPLEAGHGFKAGDKVRITRPSPQNWIADLGADKIGLYADYNLPAWRAGDFDLNFDRTVVSADAGSITVDVPLPQSFEAKYGGGYIRSFEWPGRIDHFAVENLTLESEYEKGYPKDEDHRWLAISIDNAIDGWVRRVNAVHFVSSAVAVFNGGSRITVEECKCLEPVGEIGGYRRLSYQTFGQQTLFNRCYSEEGYHDFAVGFSTAGPNAFIQCYAARTHGFSGALGGWSCGTLFDRVTVENDPIKFSYLDLDLQGGGWSSANSLCWQCRAPQIHLSDPPGAHNWAFGSRGQGYGNGSHAQNKLIRPENFYFTQYAQRGATAILSEEMDKIIRYNPDFSQTDAAFAARESARSLEPAWTIDRWIDTLVVRYPLAADAATYVDASTIKLPVKVQKAAEHHPFVLVDGTIAEDGKYLAGGSASTALWQGNPRPSGVRSAKPHLTRFVPGREGTGYTDNLNSVKEYVKDSKLASFYHFPALWYERRRDDHGRMMRADADVWAPFYEQPFARSGQLEANDRLSRYDLNRWNKWYWSRITEFSGIADETGVAFIHEHYLQHNIIEEGAHWADYPWRSSNNINDLGFPEPTYFQGDKRVFMATQFYDLTNATLKEYHRKYIRKSLDAVKDAGNVIHHIGHEYTGPAEFMEFWLSTIKEWEIENGKDVTVALSATKDVTDRILANPELNGVVDVIDIRQWYYRTDGGIFAPEGGVSLAPRQYPRVMDAGRADGECVYKAVREYRERFPEKAVIYTAGRVNGGEWIAFIAGASLCQTPHEVEAKGFYSNALKMSPVDGLCSGNTWACGKPGKGYIVFSTDGEFSVDLSSDNGIYKCAWIDPATGKTVGKVTNVKAGKSNTFTAPQTDGRPTGNLLYIYKN